MGVNSNSNTRWVGISVLYMHEFIYNMYSCILTAYNAWIHI
jgi:hypothetical protein